MIQNDCPFRATPWLDYYQDRLEIEDKPYCPIPHDYPYPSKDTIESASKEVASLMYQTPLSITVLPEQKAAEAAIQTVAAAQEKKKEKLS